MPIKTFILIINSVLINFLNTSKKNKLYAALKTGYMTCFLCIVSILTCLTDFLI